MRRRKEDLAVCNSTYMHMLSCPSQHTVHLHEARHPCPDAAAAMQSCTTHDSSLCNGHVSSTGKAAGKKSQGHYVFERLVLKTKPSHACERQFTCALHPKVARCKFAASSCAQRLRSLQTAALGSVLARQILCHYLTCTTFTSAETPANNQQCMCQK